MVDVRTAQGPTITSFDVSPAGSSGNKYTDTEPRDETQPALTVDGNWVAWTANDGFRTGNGIYAGPRSDSADGVPVPRPALLGFNGSIVFSSNRDGNYELYTMDEDGSNQTTDHDDAERRVRSSMVARQLEIVYVRDGNIWSMDADGSNAQQLTTEGGIDPSVAPDGRIAFMSTRDHVSGEIYVMNQDGSEPNATNEQHLARPRHVLVAPQRPDRVLEHERP